MKIEFKLVDRNSTLIVPSIDFHITKQISSPTQIVKILQKLDKNIILQKPNTTFIFIRTLKKDKKNLEFWLKVNEYKSFMESVEKTEKPKLVKTSYRMVDEHFGKADTSIEIVDLGEGNICVIHRDGEAKIYQSIYDMASKEFLDNSPIECLFVQEKQLEFIYTYFKDYYDIKNNFDIINTKRKTDGR